MGSDEERVAVKKDQVVGETQKIKKLKKKRARRNTERLASDEIDDLSETDDAIENHTLGHLSVHKGEALLVIDPTKPDFKNEKVSITAEEQISPKKPNDTVQVEEGTFAKPKLKKAERIRRALPKEELEVVDLKKHKLEQLALHEMIELTTSVILTKKIMDLKIKAAKARKSEQNVTLDNQGQAKSEESANSASDIEKDILEGIDEKETPD